MASSYLKNIIGSFHPIFKSFYRLLFNLVATALLIPIGYVFYFLPSEYVFTSSTTYDIIGGILALAGVYILFVGFKNYRADEFIGTYQIRHHHDFHPTKLSRNGWNGIVRHPLYFAGILLAVGLCLIFPTIKLVLTTAIVIAYLYVGSLWEEKKLRQEFGNIYNDYKQEVSMLLPVKWLKRKFLKQ